MAKDSLIPQAKAVWAGLSVGKRVILLSVIGAAAAGFFLLMAWTGKPDYQTLFSQLTPEDAGAIVGRLKEQKVPYRITMNGRCVEVPQELVHELRLGLASEGLPQGSGIGFEVFDNTKLGMTEFVQNVNYQRALQGELSRTINQFDEVESSRVHIVMPSKSLFLEDEKPATASVVLKLKNGRELGQNQIRGIVNLVSASISGLEAENVTVVDNRGRLLTNGRSPDDMAAVTSDQFQFQRKMESSMEEQIRTMLEQALGPNRAVVRVSCALDFVRHEETEEMYIPDNQVVRSEQLFNQKSVGAGAAAAGIVGIRSNTVEGNIGVGSIYPPEESEKAANQFIKNDQTRNYEIGKVVSHRVMPVGRIKRISAAVIVDGTYEAVKEKNGRKEWSYVPRTPEEMRQFENIVKSAMNFDAGRGDEIRIENIPFETSRTALNENATAVEGPSLLERFKPVFDYAFMGFFVLMTFLFLIRPLLRWLTSTPAGTSEFVHQLPKTVGQLEQEMGSGAASLPFREQANRIVRTDQQASVGVMREWLKE
ncbi:MAG: flagellar basal-body MS-ring/collar protein FliF [Desulfobacterales bacterium]